MKPLIRFTYPHSVRIGDSVVVRSWRDEVTYSHPYIKGKTKTVPAGWVYQWCRVDGITRFGGNTILFLSYSQFNPRVDKSEERHTTRVCKPADMVPVVVAGSPRMLWEGEPDGA